MCISGECAPPLPSLVVTTCHHWSWYVAPFAVERNPGCCSNTPEHSPPDPAPPPAPSCWSCWSPPPPPFKVWWPYARASAHAVAVTFANRVCSWYSSNAAGLREGAKPVHAEGAGDGCLDAEGLEVCVGLLVGTLSKKQFTELQQASRSPSLGTPQESPTLNESQSWPATRSLLFVQVAHPPTPQRPNQWLRSDSARTVPKEVSLLRNGTW
mmetsp:Transcript_1183/g.2448  ORF Transcript_1183/g.2448 Transcript_1183/m.2448 type:complete len:211 (+) Transcript_1183:397-1029(+)